MIMITTVVFDLDDTLYDEVEYCRSGFEAVAEFLANLPVRRPPGVFSVPSGSNSQPAIAQRRLIQLSASLAYAMTIGLSAS